MSATRERSQTRQLCMSHTFPPDLPSTPLVLHKSPPGSSPVGGLVNEDQMQNAFTELKKSIADMEAQLGQFEFVLNHMRLNMVRMSESTGESVGEFDEDDIALWEADAEKVKKLKNTFETDFGKRIYVYEKKIQDANGIVRRRMQFFNDVNDRFDLLRKRPELMKRMARKQAELISTLSETQRVLLKDMKAAVARYNKEKAILSAEPLPAPTREPVRRDAPVTTPTKMQSSTPSPNIARHFKQMSLDVSRPGTEVSVVALPIRSSANIPRLPPDTGSKPHQQPVVYTKARKPVDMGLFDGDVGGNDDCDDDDYADDDAEGDDEIFDDEE